MTGFDLIGMFIKSQSNKEQIAFYCLFYLVHAFKFCVLSYSVDFLRFSTPSQKVKFHVHRSHMEIGLCEVIKLCTRKMIEKTLFVFPSKMINLFQGVVTNVFS